ncbi:MAG: hypothetical protein QJR03_04640 [Sphaerobacter sp.]|nr:hypothetical protein [Sphaerobacter sp.]
MATGSRGSAGTAGRGWLAGLADVGRSLRLGWYEGCTVLTAVTLTGVVTGWGVAPASTNERPPLAETIIAGRQRPDPRLPTGAPRSLPIWPTAASPAGPYAAHLAATYGVTLVAPLGGYRQIVETVQGRLLDAVGLARERLPGAAGGQGGAA